MKKIIGIVIMLILFPAVCCADEWYAVESDIIIQKEAHL